MASLSKRKKLAREKVDAATFYQIDEALTLEFKRLVGAAFLYRMYVCREGQDVRERRAANW